MIRKTALFAVFAVLGAAFSAAQLPYTPKFPGDPARSNPEAAALGYMRVVVNAQKLYKKKNQKYATSLSALVGKGSFTRRLVATDRGDYTVAFRGGETKYSLAMMPKTFDAEHRAFYVDESGVIRADEQQAATRDSERLTADAR